MKLFFSLFLIFFLVLSLVSCKEISSPPLKAIQKNVTESVSKNGFLLTLSILEISSDMKTIKIKEDLKNISKKDMAITVSECSPDHFYEVSINKGEFFEPIKIIHIKFCGVEKIFKPGENYSTVMSINYKEAIKTIKARYRIENKYIESNEIEICGFEK